MSQWRKITSFLKASKDPSVDQALMLAMPRAAGRFQDGILQSLAQRGQTVSGVELIEQFHTFEPERQRTLVLQAEAMQSGLRQVVLRGSLQGKRNALEIIDQARADHLVDAAALLLRQREGDIAEQAGKLLIEIAQNDAARQLLEQSEGGQAGDKRIARRQHLREALSKAIDQYRTHRRAEVVTAAMILYPATDEPFWGNSLSRFDPVGQEAIARLKEPLRPELSAFCLTALTLEDLRLPGIGALSGNLTPACLARVAQALSKHATPEIRRCLKMIKDPHWLNAYALQPDLYEPQDQTAVLGLVLSVGAKADRKLSVMRELAAKGAVSVGKHAIRIAEDLPSTQQGSILSAALTSEHESVASQALGQLLRMDDPQRKQWLMPGLRSAHTTVRQLVMNHLGEVLMQSFWNQYESLTEPQRESTARTLFKFDHAMSSFWKQKAHSGETEDRFRAVQVARLLPASETRLTTLLDLCADSNAHVRSSAISALGDLAEPWPEAIVDTLQQRLDDADPRVRANAIEVLGPRRLRPMAKKLLPFLKSDTARERANAIRTFMQWKVGAAGAAIEQMLNDPREDHRNSAAWVRRQGYRDGTIKPLERIRELVHVI